MLECNDAMVFIDLDETWTSVCSSCKGGTNAAECTPLTTPNATSYSTVLVCQQVRATAAGPLVLLRSRSAPPRSPPLSQQLNARVPRPPPPRTGLPTRHCVHGH